MRLHEAIEDLMDNEGFGITNEDITPDDFLFYNAGDGFSSNEAVKNDDYDNFGHSFTVSDFYSDKWRVLR